MFRSSPSQDWTDERSHRSDDSEEEHAVGSGSDGDSDGARSPKGWYCGVGDANATVRFLEYMETQDLRATLAPRAHFERLVDRYWDQHHRGPHGRSTAGSEEEEDAGEAGKDRSDAHSQKQQDRLETLLQHPVVGTPPATLRWPLSARTVPHPRWSFDDEIFAILQTEQRRRRKGAQAVSRDTIADDASSTDEGPQRSTELSEESDDDDDDDDDGDDDDPNQAQSLPMSIVLPTIAHCQAALRATLSDMATRSTSRKGKLVSQRHTIVTWRDVLRQIESRSAQVPLSVLEATQARLHDIFGDARIVPDPASLAAAGADRGSVQDLLQAVMDKDGDQDRSALDKSIHYDGVLEKRKRREVRAATNALRRSAEDALLEPVNRSRRYLDKAPSEPRLNTDGASDAERQASKPALQQARSEEGADEEGEESEDGESGDIDEQVGGTDEEEEDDEEDEEEQDVDEEEGEQTTVQKRQRLR